MAVSKRVRVPVDTGSFSDPRDKATNQRISLWRASGFVMDIGLHYGTEFITDVGNLQSLTVQLKAMASESAIPAPSDPAVASKTVSDIDGGVTAESWANNTAQHARLEFSAAETNLAPGWYWIVFVGHLVTGESPQTFSAGRIQIVEDAFSDGVEDPPELETLLDQLDARYVQRATPAIFESVALTDPGVHSMDEAEAELDDNDVLHVPTPGRGNILLVRRAEDPAGGDEIDSFTGLVPGTFYYLVHDDAGGAIDFGDYEITDDGRPLPIRAISETEAVPFVTEPKA